MENRKKIALVTTGQPSSNPRLVKEANSLVNNGYDVLVIYCYWASWAQINDLTIFKDVSWQYVQVGGNPVSQSHKWWLTRIRQKICSYAPNIPYFTNRAITRAYDELLTKCVQINADLYIAHNLGALPVVASAAQRLKKLYAFDAEDFHRGESEAKSKTFNRTSQIEERYFPNAAFISGASPLITTAYKALFPSINMLAINNVFSIDYQKNIIKLPPVPLKIIWFSQTVGYNRGIQDVLKAMRDLQNISIVFTIVGQCNSKLAEEFSNYIRFTEHKIIFIDPISEKELFNIVSEHHIGLALEPGFSINNSMALSNKIFTYLLAGTAIIASETEAQLSFMTLYPGIGKTYPIGDISTLKSILLYFYNNYLELSTCRENAWKLAREELNWEIEQQKFLTLVSKALSTLR